MESKEIRGLYEAYAAVYDEDLRSEFESDFLEEDLSFVDDLSDNELDQIMEDLFLSREIDINECFDSLDYVLTEARVTSSDDRPSGSARVTTSAERPSRARRTAERQREVRVGRLAQAAQRTGERLASAARSKGTSVSGRVRQAQGRLSSARERVMGFLSKVGRAAKSGAEAARKEFSGEAGKEAKARTTGREMRRAARRQVAASNARNTSEFSGASSSGGKRSTWRPGGENVNRTFQSSGSSGTSSSGGKRSTWRPGGENVNRTFQSSGSSVRGALPPAKDSDRRQAAKAKLAKASAGSTAKGIRFAGERVGQLASQRAHTGHQSALEKFRKKSGISEDLLNDILNSIFEDLINEGYADTFEDALYILESFSDYELEEIAESYLVEDVETFDLYDVVLEHLLDEGYADTIESAEAIMVSMSEEWRDDILDEAQIMSVSGKGGLKYMINPNVLKLQNAAAKEAQGRKARQNAASQATNAKRSAQARKTSIQRLNAKPGADSGDYDAGYHGDDDTSDGSRHYSLSHTSRSARKRRETGR